MAATPTGPRGEEQPLSAARQAATRRLRRLNYFSLPALAVALVLTFIPNPPLPLLIAKVALMAILVVVVGFVSIRFSLWQRDEYWRERGRDPKHPERFPGNPPAAK